MWDDNATTSSAEEESFWEFTPRDKGNECDSDSDIDDENITSRSAKLRDEKPHEYIPVPHGGYAVYFNQHKGSQNRERIPSKKKYKHDVFDLLYYIDFVYAFQSHWMKLPEARKL
jgi:hypothetical protein